MSEITVHPIEPLDGMTASRAFGINENGKICAVSFSGQEKEVAMTWELPGVRVILPAPAEGGNTSVWGINDFGQVSGFFRTDKGGKYIVRWPDAVTVEKSSLMTEGESRAYDIANDGTVVGVMTLPENENTPSRFYHGILFDGKQVRDLGTLNLRGPLYRQGYSIAHGINNRGEVVGIAADASQRFRPFIYDRHRGLRQLPVDSDFVEGQWYAAVINDHHLVGGPSASKRGRVFPITGMMFPLHPFVSPCRYNFPTEKYTVSTTWGRWWALCGPWGIPLWNTPLFLTDSPGSGISTMFYSLLPAGFSPSHETLTIMVRLPGPDNCMGVPADSCLMS
ncbi:DUF3466 family protein [Desulfomarina profundi]|uniref:DUF3466 family protein n=1 Tax=Desulfomarina profundi TaxID=2772557 RepID=UPI001E2D24EB|nr:DUF3466 family protein [Desulfomarina profundi]